MNHIEALVKAWSSHVVTPWAGGLSGGEKVWFCVYDKADERRLRLHLPEFEGAAKKSGHGWDSLDLTDSFATWMAAEEYRECKDYRHARRQCDVEYCPFEANGACKLEG